jgi:hypothetical protein
MIDFRAGFEKLHLEAIVTESCLRQFGDNFTCIVVELGKLKHRSLIRCSLYIFIFWKRKKCTDVRNLDIVALYFMEPIEIYMIIIEYRVFLIFSTISIK